MSSSVSGFAMILASDLQQSHIIFTLQVGMHVSYPVGDCVRLNAAAANWTFDW
jgi:hypothetical protein